MSKHEMMFERGGMKKAKKKAVKTTKKGSAIARKWKAAKRTISNVLASVGIVVLVIWMFQFVVSR